jgi:hypothetical protein
VDELPSPLPPPGPDDFIICGCPRTGTSLLTAALFQPPVAVTVMEPWDGMRLAPAALFASLRGEIDRTGRLGRGRLDVAALRERGVAEWCAEGDQSPAVAVEPGWKLGVKWPSYWRYLDRLPSTRFVVCLRDPVAVVASLAALSGPGRYGFERNTKFDRSENEALRAATADPAVRRVLMFDYVHERLLPHLGRDQVHVVRYERWFQDQEGVLADLGRFLDADLGHSQVRPVRPAAHAHPDPAVAELVRRHSRTAAALGY